MNHQNKIPSVVLAIGGIDPSGGAGLFADQRAVEFAGGHFCGICSAITIQNGLKFFKMIAQPPDDICAAMDLIFEDRPIRAVKTGALGSAANIEVVVQWAKQNPHVPLIVDPVLRSTTGSRLFSPEAEHHVQKELLPQAALITPNIPEAALLCGRPIHTADDMVAAAEELISQGAGAVLIKGGHLNQTTLVDVLATSTSPPRKLIFPRLDVGEVRGTGCTLASLIATHIALGDSVQNGVEKARAQLHHALPHAIRPGSGPKILTFYTS